MTTAPDIFLSYNREDQAVAGTRQPTSQGSALGSILTVGFRPRTGRSINSQATGPPGLKCQILTTKRCAPSGRRQPGWSPR